jgi:carbamoyltransferase
MIVIGLSGGFDPLYGFFDAESNTRLDLPIYSGHDAAAVLVKDGTVLAAIEEERVSRIKHTNIRPTRAIEYCLNTAGLRLADVDYFAYYWTEQYFNNFVADLLKERPQLKRPASGRAFLESALRQDLGPDFDSRKLVFVSHHVAHAISAYAMSGYDSSLVITLDGQGDNISGAVFRGERGDLQHIVDVDIIESLGFFYLEIIKLIGFDLFDEYKVMGLAPYGDPARFRKQMRETYQLKSRGLYAVELPPAALARVVPPRKPGGEILQEHKDLAASLQEALEEIALHHITHYRNEIYSRAPGAADKPKRLCLAGGVAHNCTLNGKILKSGLFDDVFIQPAAHDAGCALGAALYIDRKFSPKGESKPARRLQDVYWGKNIGDGPEIEKLLKQWADVVDFRLLDDVPQVVARLLKDGAVVGWAQGRSEFGPRALGNRSILADPRPAENKDVINSMVKKREAFRPFAPAVLEEYAGEYFDIPAGREFPFMTFVVPVREKYRPILGAVTHVDGTARVQTVSKHSNPRFWQLIDAFRAQTGVPVLLNTSFNNNAEPIVDSAADAMACFLTTGLSHLVLGDYLVIKRDNPPEQWLNMHVALPGHIRVMQVTMSRSDGDVQTLYQCVNVATKRSVEISSRAHELISRCRPGQSMGELVMRSGDRLGPEDKRALSKEIFDLWGARMLALKPAGA